MNSDDDVRQETTTTYGMTETAHVVLQCDYCGRYIDSPIKEECPGCNRELIHSYR